MHRSLTSFFFSLQRFSAQLFIMSFALTQKQASFAKKCKWHFPAVFFSFFFDYNTNSSNGATSPFRHLLHAFFFSSFAELLCFKRGEKQRKKTWCIPLRYSQKERGHFFFLITCERQTIGFFFVMTYFLFFSLFVFKLYFSVTVHLY